MHCPKCEHELCEQHQQGAQEWSLEGIITVVMAIPFGIAMIIFGPWLLTEGLSSGVMALSTVCLSLRHYDPLLLGPVLDLVAHQMPPTPLQAFMVVQITAGVCLLYAMAAQQVVRVMGGRRL